MMLAALGSCTPSPSVESESDPAVVAESSSETGEVQLLGSREAVDEWIAAHRGKVVVLNYWATWCPPCRDEMPVLVDYAKRMSGESIAVLGLSFDSEDEIDSVLLPFMKESGIEFPIAVFTGESDSFIKSMPFGWDGSLPMTYFLDESGAFRHVHAGEITRQELESAVVRVSKP